MRGIPFEGYCGEYGKILKCNIQSAIIEYL